MYAFSVLDTSKSTLNWNLQHHRRYHRFLTTKLLKFVICIEKNITV